MRPVIILSIAVSAVSLIACAAPPRIVTVADPPRKLVLLGQGEPAAIRAEAPKSARKGAVRLRLNGTYVRPSDDVEPMPVLVPDSSRVVRMPTMVPDPRFDHQMPVAGRKYGGTYFRIRGRSNLAPAPAPIDLSAADSTSAVQP